MDHETQGAVDPTHLTDQLSEVAPERHEARSAFLGKAALLFEEAPDHQLTQTEAGYAARILLDWELHLKPIGDKRNIIAPRPGSFTQRRRETIARTARQAGHDALTTRRGGITLLSNDPLTTKIVAVALRIEESIADTPRPRDPVPSTPRVIEKRLIKTGSGLLLSPRELEITNLLALPSENIATQAGLEKYSVSHYVKSALRRNPQYGDSKRLFLTSALNDKLIDLSHLPRNREPDFDKIDHQLLKWFIFSKHRATAKAFRLSESFVAKRWVRIRHDLGIEGFDYSHIRTFLVAKRDGLT